MAQRKLRVIMRNLGSGECVRVQVRAVTACPASVLPAQEEAVRGAVPRFGY